MAKIIKYKFLAGEVNHGTEEEPNVEQIILPAKIKCDTQAQFDANFPMVEQEAIPYTIEISGEFDPEPEPTPAGDAVTWDELDAAYTTGYEEGYTEGVNGAYGNE